MDAYPSRTFTGRVVQIRNSPITVQNVVTYDTVIGVTNSDFKLKPGMTATVSITTAQRTNVLKIPNAALRFKPPEPSTNQTLVARLLAKVGLGEQSQSPPRRTPCPSRRPAAPTKSRRRRTPRRRSPAMSRRRN